MQAVTVDADHLEQLGILGHRRHALTRLRRQPVLLGPGHADQVLRRVLAFRHPAATAVDVVVPLQHQVDAMPFQHRQHFAAQDFVVAVLARREHRLVHHHDVPAPRAGGQHPVQPRRLRTRGAQVQRRGAVEYHDPRILRIEPVGGRGRVLDAVARQGEAHRPVRAQHPAFLRGVLELLEVLVIARRRRDHERGGQRAAGFEPLAPLVVVLAIATADQIAGEQRQACIRRMPLRLAQHPGDVADVLVLGVAQVQQGQRRAGRRGGAGVVPRTPGAAALHAPGVQGVRLQSIDLDAVVGSGAIFGFQQARARAQLPRRAHVRGVTGDHDFQQRRLHRHGGAPGHGQAGGRILRRRHHDPVGEYGRRVARHPGRHPGIGFGPGRRRLGSGLRRAAAQAQQHQQQRGDGEGAAGHQRGHAGSSSAVAMSRQSNAATPWSRCEA